MNSALLFSLCRERDSSGIMITGLPCAGKSLLFEMLSHTVCDYDLRNGWIGIHPRTISKHAGAVFSISSEESKRCVVMRRSKDAILERHTGELIPAFEQWERAIQSLRESGALVLQFDDLRNNPRLIQELLAERFGLRYKEGAYFDQCRIQDLN